MPETTRAIQYRYRAKKGSVHLQGTLDVSLALELKQTLLEAMGDQRANELCLDLTRTERLDISAIQLILSLRNACLEANRPFSIRGTPSEIQSTFSKLGVCL